MQPPIRHVGREGNRLDDRISGLVTSADEYRNEYVDRDGEWRRVVLPLLAAMDRKALIERSWLHRRSIERYIYSRDIVRCCSDWRLNTTATCHQRVKWKY